VFPVKILTVFQDKPGWDLIADPGIKSIAQLRGKTIGVMSPEGSLAVVAGEILRKNGMDPAKRRQSRGHGRRRGTLPGAANQGHSGNAV
jgi:ABC-type nitrate/sulfonate/bicarbonate transport system substrate-binding protein